MQINGYIGTSFIDWPGKTAAVVFLPGCNMACGFCHNSTLQNEPAILWDNIKNDLLLHHAWLYGVVITGGEPTIHFDLPLLVAWIRDLQLGVKLDTNGTNPYGMEALLPRLDYVAMDFKAPYGLYSQACGGSVDVGKIRKSIEVLASWKGEVEFRTTIIPSIHTEASIAEMAKMLPSNKIWTLQQFNPKLARTDEYKNLTPYPANQIKRFQDIAKGLGIDCRLRL